MLNNAIIVPAYNEARTIANVVRSVAYAGRVIVVDDGSTDLTGFIATEAGAEVVSHVTNKGYDAALDSGFRKAEQLGLDTAITFDADGQHDPAVLKEFLWYLQSEGADLVIGTRPQGARIAEILFNWYVGFRYGVPDILCGLKGYQMALYRRLGRFSSNKSIGTELALFGIRCRSRVTLVQITTNDRVDRPRFASSAVANLQITRAFSRAVIKDLFVLRWKNKA